MENIATDMELANFLVYHIHNPCVEPKTDLHIREFYIREAYQVMDTIEDPVAKEHLEKSIRAYST